MDNSSRSISPLDERYRDKISSLLPVFSEFGLVKRRVYVEIEYLIALIAFLEVTILSEPQIGLLRQIHTSFSETDFQIVKQIESEIHHDVKAVELFINRKLIELKLDTLQQWVHFGLTSEDVNNIAQSLQLKQGTTHLLEAIDTLCNSLETHVQKTKDMVMLARTHGQPAVPTTLGKELAVHMSQLQHITKRISNTSFYGKLHGAVGTMAAHTVSFPDKDWLVFSESMITDLGLEPVTLTTQILPGSYWTELFSELQRLSLQLVSVSQDIWWYISFGYFKQQVVASEVGSSTMPQKVNPINFENAEGNSQIAASLFSFFVEKFSHSRLQRDLSDSTVRRNFGLAFGHLLLGIKSLDFGLHKIAADEKIMLTEVQEHPEILAEAIQTILRKHGQAEAYDVVKQMMRGQEFELERICDKLEERGISKKIVEEISILKPEEYLGLARELVERRRGN